MQVDTHAIQIRFDTISILGYGILGHAKLLAARQRNAVNFVIHNLPVIHKMQQIAKACGNTFGLMQGVAPEISGGLLIALPREQVIIPSDEFFVFIF